MAHDDPVLEAEHQAAMNLVRDGEVTHRAVRSGAWTDASTWAGGRVPKAGAVVDIGEGLEVTYDSTSQDSIFKIRVGGELDFATSRDTFLKVDTLLVTPSGMLTIGTEARPVAPAVQARIVFADNGSVNDLGWDPQQLSRGLVSHGKVEIHGQDKTDFVGLATDAMAGERTLTLAQAPEHWQVGDKIVLTGTSYSAERAIKHLPGEDEVVTIRAIDGRTVTLDRPLAFDHAGHPVDQGGELKAYAANLSRNVEFSSESAKVDHRGHVMLMHSDQVEVEHAAFLDLGRTDKSVPLDDRVVKVMPDGTYETRHVPSTEADNIRGRYALHIHRIGADLDDGKALIEGNVVWGSPGWGFVSHDSHADFIDNVAFDVLGSHFVSELGNETGRWSHNIAIGGQGRARTRDLGIDNAAQDAGYEGNGFWFNGRLIVAQDNVAAGMNGAGFSWFNRGDEMLDTKASNL